MSNYGMTKYGIFFVDEFTEWLIAVGFIESKSQMFIQYKSAPDGTKTVVLSYVDDYVY